jgi:hypothetical protein
MERMNILKLKYNNTAYKIEKLEGKTLEEIKTLAASKFGQFDKKMAYIAKFGNGKKEKLIDDASLAEAWMNCTNVDKKGRNVLMVKIREQSEAPKKSQSPDLDKVTWANWKNLTEEQKESLVQ